jgi:hypothetical protein
MVPTFRLAFQIQADARLKAGATQSKSEFSRGLTIGRKDFEFRSQK